MIRRLALGNPVAEKTLLALPARPFDWSGLANLLSSTPDITRRPALVRRWIESQTHLPTDAAALLRRAFHRAETSRTTSPTRRRGSEAPSRFRSG